MFLTRVQIENFRSIAACDVRLGPLTILAGPNAAGKSNFLDALRFVRDALRSSSGQALESRGGLEEVLHRTAAGAQADSCRIRLEANVPVIEPAGERAVLGASCLLEVGTGPDEDFTPEVRREELQFQGMPDALFAAEGQQEYRVEGWQEDQVLPRVTTRSKNGKTDALLSRMHSMRFYELHTPVLRDVDQTPRRRGDVVLGESGEHLARVLRLLAHSTPWVKETIDGYVSTMIDNVAGLDGKELPETDLAYLVGRLLDEDGREEEINRRSLSDGTLRLAGVLAALFQPLALSGSVPFIGIEAPEASLYPPVLGALYDAFVGASHNTQVMVTTQSSDLLDNPSAKPEHLLVVRADSRGSTIGPIDETGQRLLADDMLTLPELLRSGEMRPEPTMPYNAKGDGRR